MQRLLTRGATCTAHTLNSVLLGLTRARPVQLRLATEAVRAVGAAGVPPNAKTWGHLMTLGVLARDAKFALDAFAELVVPQCRPRSRRPAHHLTPRFEFN